LDRGAREGELATARAAYEQRARALRTQEHELAALDARLKSLEELEAARAGYGDAARTVLAEANGRVGQNRAVADYLEVEPGCEVAVEAGLGDVLQLVIVDRLDQAAAGFDLVRRQAAGRCGFLITSRAPAGRPGVAAGAADPPAFVRGGSPGDADG